MDRPFIAYIALFMVAFFWTAAYATIIYRGFRDRTYGMPLAALGANISWEAFFAFIETNPSLFFVNARNIVWFSLDAVMAVQCFLYAKREFRHPNARRYAQWIVAGVLLACFAVVFQYIREFQDRRGWYSGFGMNVLMSVLFVEMLLERDDIRGQSMFIGLFKFLGSFGAFIFALFFYPANVFTPLSGKLPDRYYPMSPLMFILALIITFFDIIYLVLLYRKCQAMGVNPWKRL